ncbi:S-layer homology domain-containing protein [Paenibacillus albidus]|uniref:S-layer homology domain-containing protein n=1 Tax=Paenibacillus albidus TaxID=2041023 RepID=UPI00166D0E32|nr:S-layer homology domain-containing protein [Paenibacillus albidus]
MPTKIVVIDGKPYAQINSLTNSVYSVIYSPITFADVNTHWAKEAVNDMGSRLVIDGSGEGSFEPGRDITRAEFADDYHKGTRGHAARYREGYFQGCNQGQLVL